VKDNRSVLRILSILELVSQYDQGITLGEIYRKLDMPKATAYDILQTLYKADAVYYKDPNIKNYVIGSKMYAIGSVYTKNSNLIESSMLPLKAFADQYNRVVSIAKRVEENVVFVHKYQPSQSKINISEEIGSILPLSNNNLTCLAYRYFDHRIKDISLNHFESINQRQYLMTSEDHENHECTIASPIYNFENRVVGVMTTYDFLDDKDDRINIANHFTQIAKGISKKLGYIAKNDSDS
jgi:DNA-binding IclR family transcriptional regulator